VQLYILYAAVSMSDTRYSALCNFVYERILYA
jgi:hypothetical protein